MAVVSRMLQWRSTRNAEQRLRTRTTIADQQKITFKKQQHASKHQKLIFSGLWAYVFTQYLNFLVLDDDLPSCSRHPNYCEEVLAWIGVALMCYSTMTSRGCAAPMSPLFVDAFLIKVFHKRVVSHWTNAWSLTNDMKVTPSIRNTKTLNPLMSPFK